MVCKSNLRPDKPSMNLMVFRFPFWNCVFWTWHVSSYKYFSMPLTSKSVHSFLFRRNTKLKTECMLYHMSPKAYVLWSLTFYLLEYASCPASRQCSWWDENIQISLISHYKPLALSPGVTSRTNLNWRCSAAYQVSFRFQVIHYLNILILHNTLMHQEELLTLSQFQDCVTLCFSCCFYA